MLSLTVVFLAVNIHVIWQTVNYLLRKRVN